MPENQTKQTKLILIQIIYTQLYDLKYSYPMQSVRDLHSYMISSIPIQYNLYETCTVIWCQVFLSNTICKRLAQLYDIKYSYPMQSIRDLHSYMMSSIPILYNLKETCTDIWCQVFLSNTICMRLAQLYDVKYSYPIQFVRDLHSYMISSIPIQCNL